MGRVAAAGVGLTLLLTPAAWARPLDKVDGALLGARPHAKMRAGAVALAPKIQVTRGRALVDVYVRGAVRPGARRLRRLGMRVGLVSGRSPERMVEGWLPLSRLGAVAKLHATKAVMSVPPGLTNTGSVLSQGDAAHHGPQARALGPTGQGVPVGIVSDSINQVGGGVAGSQTSGDLPADVEIIQDKSGGSDEGRAMAEIVYDTAPGIPKILFGSGTISPATRAANIDALVAGGAKVIADDTVFLTEPFFQDGVVAQAVDRAKASGTAYFVSAGNRARQNWEGTYADSGSGLNDFGGGDTQQTVVALPNNGAITMVLQWAEPWGAANTDFAIEVTHGLVTQTADFQNTSVTHIPFESFSYQNTTGANETLQIAIRRVSGSGTPPLKWIANANFTFTPAEHNTNSSAIDPDAASARGSLAVAAVNQSDSGHDSVEPFSSRGPSVTRRFDATGSPITPDVRPKPDIAAADGVDTSVGPDFAPFFGTSAAAPSAAAVGALLMSARPSLPIDELYAILRQPANAADCTAAGFPDADCGAGFIFADGKLGQALDATPPDIAPVLPPPDGANGWFRRDVTLTWNVGDTGSPVLNPSNCGPQTVTSDGIRTFTCSALSAGGTTSQPVTIKRDASPPTIPTFAGITSGTFNAKRLPGAARVACSATDPTSGVDSCAISGFSRRPGSHTVGATATNDAGLQSTATLTYKVRPYVLRRLRVPRRISLAALRSRGLPIRFKARAKSTVRFTLERRSRRVASAIRRFKRGAGHTRLRGRRAGRLTLVVNATSTAASNVTFTRHVRVTG